MAKLRLFANLREAAGTGSAEVPGGTVGEVLDAAVAAYGDDFAAGLTVANMWVNGENADRSTPVAATDELALIPPVSGGSQPLGDAATVGEGEATDWTDTTPALLGLILLATFLIANIISLQALAFAAVGGALAWLWDLADTLAARRLVVPAIPTLVATTLAGNAAYRWGEAGLAAGLAAGLIVVLVWCIGDAASRNLETIAAAEMMTLVAGLGAGAMILVRRGSPVPVTAFLILMVLAAVASWAVRRFLPDIGGLDPNLAAAIGVLVGALVVGLVADTLSPAVSLIAGAAAVAGWLAGRSLGSLLRAGDVSHTTRAPGLLTTVDGVILASSTFWIGLLLFG